MKNREKLRKFLANTGRKGCVETLEIIQEQKGIHYNEILKHMLDKKVLKGTSYISTILNLLLEAQLIEKQADTSARPIRTEYSITKLGTSILRLLHSIENELKTR